MASPADSKVIAYIADISDVKAKLTQLTTLNSKLGVNIGKDLSTNFKKVGDSLGQIKTTEFRSGLQGLANTSTKTTQAMKGLDGSLINVTKTTAVNAKGIAKTTTAYQDLSTNSVSLGQNIYRLASRAALTIPLWLALRGAVMGVISTFKNGIQTILDQDRAFQKAKRNLQGTTQEIENNFEKLQEAALNLSLQTGESVEKITTAFQKFATTGLDFETSMSGAISSVKTAILLFGDTEEVANAVARAFRVLGGRTKEYRTTGEELEAFLAQVSELWKDNAFEVNEFAGAFERFAATAKTSNVSLKETAVLLGSLQTAGMRGTRAGRLLSTAVIQMEKNFDSFGRRLGVNLNSVDTTFERVRLVTGAIEELSKTDMIAASQAVSSLFQIRGGESIKALAGLNKHIDDAIQKTADIEKFNKEFKEQNEQIHRLGVQFTNLNKEIGKAFVTGVVGGKDFHDTMKILVQTQNDALQGFSSFGKGLNIAFTLLQGKIPTVIKKLKELNDVDLSKAQRHVEELFNLSEIKDAGIVSGLLGRLEDVIPTGIFGYKKSYQEEIRQLLLERLDQLEQVATKQKIINDLQEKENKKISPENKQEIANVILKAKLAELKLQGALQSQLLQAEKILINRLGIEEQTIDKISRQIELERELSQERRLQSELGNESLKVFRIAQTEGVDVAKQIGDVLSGVTSFDTFMRADRFADAAEIFKKEFADKVEQEEAKRFFKGQTIVGKEDLRGGYGIGIQEEAIRNRGFTAVPAQLMQERAERQFQQLEREKVVVSAPVNFNVTTDISKLSELEQEFLAKVSAELPRLGTELNSALQTAIKNTLVGKQSPTV